MKRIEYYPEFFSHWAADRGDPNPWRLIPGPVYMDKDADTGPCMTEGDAKFRVKHFLDLTFLPANKINLRIRRVETHETFRTIKVPKAMLKRNP